ncbi:MAG: hypothetical protein AAF657_32125 [Acidobacteriota bacterium]
MPNRIKPQRIVFSLVFGLFMATASTAQLWGPNDLEAAIAAAPDGGVIDLPAGTFDFTNDWNPPNPLGKSLTFRGTGHTVLQGHAAERFLRSRADIAIEGIELQDFAVGVYLTPDSGQTIRASFERVRFVGIDTGIWALGHANANTGLESFVVRDCEFENGLWGIDVRLPTYRNVHIESNTFTDFQDRGVNLGSTLYDPDENRSQIFVHNNTVRRVGAGSIIQPIGIIVHGNHCFLTSNYVEQVNADAGGEAAGLYTKCMYSKVLGNTVVDSSASFLAAFNGAITIKGKERNETNGPFGFGAMVANNHVIFNDKSRPTRISVKIHADWVHVHGNISEHASQATFISLPSIGNHVTVDDEVLWNP